METKGGVLLCYFNGVFCLTEKSRKETLTLEEEADRLRLELDDVEANKCQLTKKQKRLSDAIRRKKSLNSSRQEINSSLPMLNTIQRSVRPIILSDEISKYVNHIVK